ncbi:MULTISPECIES: cysteine desulfurase-like protein [Micromonospora]|uniref:Cysteine desulfurase-like protein n=1 Tax=Micromonospora solifontis TaxID=2487138 RepID=A0ABX9WBN3_9ACTN|nr:MULTISPECIES: cysteine desulfurase-like protein [Micromonospora]NES13387.1 cysteine desulfurase-like protein [Micromonospora sp. PPF5-17B]NES39366.1 cysteine desulfurase-like protein [Micromonospora solifontis]NES55597.1 cysteine desulfurase-like protein [Micromonospora sp. PPF5-6]RNL89171.1 cysteine desulfurase-like protein [Micromonospora solifontis]
MAFDIARVRAAYPALTEGFVHFDGAGGTQTAQPVIDAVAAAMGAATGNRSTAFIPGRRSLDLVAAARSAVADLLGGQPEGVVLGPSATALTYTLARTLGAGWRPGDEVVVSRLDHDANVRPWVQAAEAAGATVRWAEFDRATGELPAGQYADLVGERTRLVAVTAGSNAIGTAPDVAAIAKTAHAAGALVCVDGVHAVPHGPVDVASLGADFLVTSAYKWSGPHLAAMVADPARWETLRPAKLLPSSDAVPDRFEYGTPSFPLLAGVAAAVDHLATLDPAATGSRRERVRAGLAAAQAHEEAVFDRLLAGLTAHPAVTVYGSPARRCPTVSFRVAGRTPAETAAALGAAGCCLSSGDYYAYEYFQAMGLRDSGGAVRASVYHYNTVEEVDRLLAELDRLAGGGATMAG